MCSSSSQAAAAGRWHTDASIFKPHGEHRYRTMMAGQGGDHYSAPPPPPQSACTEHAEHGEKRK